MKVIIPPKKIAQIDGSEPTIFDTGCPNCIAPAYSGPCTAQACSPSISYDGTLPAFIDPDKVDPIVDDPAEKPDAEEK